MPRRKKKQNPKYYGTRTHGRGNVKRGRGKGNKGGKGNAGWNKHHWLRTIKSGVRSKKNKGFSNPTKSKIKTINLFHIADMIEKGKIEQKDGRYIYDFKGKILGTGTITIPITIKALAFTKKARIKIEDAGGTAELIEPVVKEVVKEKEKEEKQQEGEKLNV